MDSWMKAKMTERVLCLCKADQTAPKNTVMLDNPQSNSDDRPSHHGEVAGSLSNSGISTRRFRRLSFLAVQIFEPWSKWVCYIYCRGEGCSRQAKSIAHECLDLVCRASMASQLLWVPALCKGVGLRWHDGIEFEGIHRCARQASLANKINLAGRTWPPPVLTLDGNSCT